ncbi:MAG TPA: hypothetical protein VIA81_01350, partial [Acidimicrobiia bacterium]
MRHLHSEVAVIGQGESGRAEAARLANEAKTVVTIDGSAGEEAVGVYAGPLVITRTPQGTVWVHCDEVVVATGASERHPVCPGNDLPGIVTGRAAETLAGAGIDLGRVVRISSVHRLLRIEGRE